MRAVLGREALFSMGALLISAIVLQTIYAAYIRPHAEAILALPAPAQGPQAGSSGRIAPTGSATTRNLRSVFVILKDYEQETALILACWALALIGYHARAVARNRRLHSTLGDVPPAEYESDHYAQLTQAS